MSKYIYSLSLPKIVLEPLSAYLAQQGFLIHVGTDRGRLNISKGCESPLAVTKSLPYIFKFKTDEIQIFNLVKDFIDTFQMQNLMAGNEEKEVRGLMRRDPNFRIAVKRLEKLWLEKEQQLDPKDFVDGTLNG